jgi:surfactin synthase thioesterase subunit
MMAGGMSRDVLQEWWAETSAGFAVREVPGPHLYLQEAQVELVAHLTAALLPRP